MPCGLLGPTCLGINYLAIIKHLMFYLRLNSYKNTTVGPSVCLPVCPSACHTFFTMFLSLYHHDIFRRYYHWQKWCPYKRSRLEVKGQGHRSRNKFCSKVGVAGLLTQVWMHRWLRNDTQSLQSHRRGALLLLFFKVISQTSGSHGPKKGRFWPKLSVSEL